MLEFAICLAILCPVITNLSTKANQQIDLKLAFIITLHMIIAET